MQTLAVGDRVSFVTTWDAADVKVGTEVVDAGKVTEKKVAGAWVTLTTDTGKVVKTTKRKPVRVRVFGVVESVMDGLVGVEVGTFDPNGAGGLVSLIRMISLVRPEKIETGTW